MSVAFNVLQSKCIQLSTEYKSAFYNIQPDQPLPDAEFFRGRISRCHPAMQQSLVRKIGTFCCVFWFCTRRVASNLLAIVKCTTECCSPFSSPWLQLFPNRFPTPPVVLTESNQSMCLAKPDDLPENFCFSDPSIANALHIDLSNIPYDTYCPSAAGTLTERTCPVCLMNFPSNAQMLVHRRAQHKYSRVKLGADYEEKLLELSTDVNVILSYSDDGYTCVLKNGYVQVQNLPDDHEAVIRFKEAQKEKVPMQSLTAKDWAQLIPAASENT